MKFPHTQHQIMHPEPQDKPVIFGPYTLNIVPQSSSDDLTRISVYGHPDEPQDIVLCAETNVERDEFENIAMTAKEARKLGLMLLEMANDVDPWGRASNQQN